MVTNLRGSRWLLVLLILLPSLGEARNPAGARLRIEKLGDSYLHPGSETRDEKVGEEGPFLPYEQVTVRVYLPEQPYLKIRAKEDRNGTFTSDCRLNGKKLPRDAFRDMYLYPFEFKANGRVYFGMQGVHLFGYGGCIPTEPGQYRLDLELSMPLGRWEFHNVKLEIKVPPEEKEAYDELMKVGAHRFLEHRYGFRMGELREKGDPLPYLEVKSFMQRFPDSKFSRVLYRRALWASYRVTLFWPYADEAELKGLAEITALGEVKRIKEKLKSWQEMNPLKDINGISNVQYRRKRLACRETILTWLKFLEEAQKGKQ